MLYSVLHLSEVERETGQGVDRDDLITWYLEQKESQFESVAELEHEKELIGKALTKLAKVRSSHNRRCVTSNPDCRSGLSLLQDKYLLELRGAPDQDSLAPSESDPANAENAAQGQDNKVHYVVRECLQPSHRSFPVID